MPRKRMLDPCIWDDADFGGLPVPARLLFIGLISLADDTGRGSAKPAELRKQIFGFDLDVRTEDISAWLDVIGETMRSVEFYEIDDRPYYHLVNWEKYQKVSHPSPSKLPEPSDDPELAFALQQVLEAWASHFPDKPQPRASTNSLRAKFRARWKSKDFREKWLDAMSSASASPTLHEESWFDLYFLLNNDVNYQKCIDHWMSWKDNQKGGKSMRAIRKVAKELDDGE